MRAFAMIQPTVFMMNRDNSAWNRMRERNGRTKRALNTKFNAFTMNETKL